MVRFSWSWIDFYPKEWDDLENTRRNQTAQQDQPHISRVEAGQRRITMVALKEFAKVYKKDINLFLK